jgi:MFS family permease
MTPPDFDAAKKLSVALVVAVILTAVLEVLNITIVSVAIPHMLGSFGATSDQITWVLTSYLVSAAVVMPLTGYLSARLGRKRLLTFSILGFVISSALCGISWNLQPFNPAVPPYLSDFNALGLNAQSPAATGVIGQQIDRQAQMLAFVDLFSFIGVVTLLIVPLLLMMKRPQRDGVFIPAHA